MNNNKTVDRRVRKTKRAIKNAFAKLFTEKDVNDITIKDIADLADINRKTFYNYYSGVYQLVNEIENEILDSFKTAMDGIDINKAMKEPYIIFEKLTEIISTDLEFYGHLFSSDTNISLKTKIVSLLKENAKETLQQQPFYNDQIIDIILDFALSGMLNVYRQWFTYNRNQPIKEVSEAVGVMCFDGINGLAKWYGNNK